MRLYGYTCPACGSYNKTTEGAIILGVGIQVLCQACEYVETITRSAVERLARDGTVMP